MADFPHASRPGHYGIEFDPELRSALEVLATALVPGDETYPSAGQAQVVEFIESRSSAADLQAARRVVSSCAHDSVEDAASALLDLEMADPEAFAWLRDFVYYGYYASRRVIAVMADRGYRYHGAPQPLGYAITETMLVPANSRGGYLETDEVQRVHDQ